MPRLVVLLCIASHLAATSLSVADSHSLRDDDGATALPTDADELALVRPAAGAVLLPGLKYVWSHMPGESAGFLTCPRCGRIEVGCRLTAHVHSLRSQSILLQI
jgi:hypothetical protein